LRLLFKYNIKKWDIHEVFLIHTITCGIESMKWNLAKIPFCPRLSIQDYPVTTKGICKTNAVSF